MAAKVEHKQVKLSLQQLQLEVDDRWRELREELQAQRQSLELLRQQQESFREEAAELRAALQAPATQLRPLLQAPAKPPGPGPAKHGAAGAGTSARSRASSGAEAEEMCSGAAVPGEEVAGAGQPGLGVGVGEASPSDVACGAGASLKPSKTEGLGGSGPAGGEALDQAYYAFSESVWSATIFIGSPMLQVSDSIIVGVLLILTVVMQLLFGALVLSNFTTPEFSPETVAGLRAWRLSVGHNMRYIDEINRMSLVSRVCSSSDFHLAALEVSAEQAAQVELIRKYLPAIRTTTAPTWMDTFVGGPVLCVFILMCYYATLVQEFQDILRMMWGLVQLPRRRLSVLPAEGDHLRVGSIGYPRLTLVTMSLGFRAVIGVMLCYAGTLFIVNTVDMRDLLMNALALAFVLEIDELLYSAMAPVRVRNIIGLVEPLPLLDGRRGKYLRCRLPDFMSIGTMLLLGVGTVAAYLLATVPLIRELTAAEAAICGGSQSFVFAVDGGGTLSWTQSEPALGGRTNSTHLTRALEEVIDSSGSGPVGKSRQVLSLQKLSERWKQSVADAADEGRCYELPMDVPLQELFCDLLGSPISRCADLQQFCDDKGIVGVRARQACPETCGCSSFRGPPLFHRAPLQGCGSMCPETAEWMADTRSGCWDMKYSQQTSGMWRNFTQALENHAVELRDEVESSFWQRVADVFRNISCDAIPHVHANYSQDLCLNSDLRPALLAVCPHTCGCNIQPVKGCPITCFRTRYGVGFMSIASAASQRSPSPPPPATASTTRRFIPRPR